MARLHARQNARTVFKAEIYLKINDDVNALAWVPNSVCELVVAAEDNLVHYDTRKEWANQLVEEGHNKRVTSIKFDPQDSKGTTFATLN